MMVPTPSSAQSESDQPIRVGIVGLVHSHVHWLLGRENRGDIEIVGISEANVDLSHRYAAKYGLDSTLLFIEMNAMLAATNPDAVVVFTNIADHLQATRIAAEHGVHVMVEKPLAVSMDHAREMKRLADSSGIHLLTNYETTWYPSFHTVKRLADDGEIGEVRKLVAHFGHPGPIEIGVEAEFLAWLLDPELNGAGALTDFGCYGANLATWFVGGDRPLSVTAVIQTNKPDLYPEVDDEATIVLEYPDAQAVIQASWNWPFGRKDLEVYGATGYAIAPNASSVRVRRAQTETERAVTPSILPPEYADAFAYLAAVVRGDADPRHGLSSLANNMVVMEILDAARESAATRRTVRLDQHRIAD